MSNIIKVSACAALVCNMDLDSSRLSWGAKKGMIREFFSHATQAFFIKYLTTKVLFK